MSKYITRIRTTTGDSQIDYNALANQPLKMTTINLFATDQAGTNSPFNQTVSITDITYNSKIDLQPTPEQIVELQDADIILMISNNNSIATAYAFGTKPTKDYEMQVLITEVQST